MHSRLIRQVLVCVSSLLLSEPHDVTGAGLSCVRASPARGGRTRVAFLREDAAGAHGGARSLDSTVWSGDMRPVTRTQVQGSRVAAEGHLALCGAQGPQTTARRLGISLPETLGAPCAPASPSAPASPRRARRDGAGGKARRKRGWLFPGTLWCGKGSEAVRYEDLGMFENADRCCREHDHCSHIIPSFTVNYGVFNSHFYTLSHCDCDLRFRRCLLDVNDTIASMVGYSFFSILRIPCFDLKQQKGCTQMYWWGMCKEAKEAPFAIFMSPLPYNSSDVTTPKQSRCCGSRRRDTFWPLCKSCLAQETTSRMTTGTAATAADSPPDRVTTLRTSPLREATDTPKQDASKILWNTATKRKTTATVREDGEPLKPMDSHLLGDNTTQKAMGGDIVAQSIHVKRNFKQSNALPDHELLCGSLKHLDDCNLQIPPLEKKYDLQNMDSKTAYHCDCTTRLAVQIKSFKQPSILPTVLRDFVSPYCFKLKQKDKKCHRRKSCSGGFIKSSDLLRALKKVEGKDTAGVQNSVSGRKRGIPVRLFKRCLRLEREADIMAQLT
ncbi:putative group 3 secretory phospholipase A2-like [Scophthalmus maximus]|uniref:phospholipase A2 n=1 Tax=Scophthalmus maximus TaxID=52904 RepID=A0A2U9BSC7_SCOMX|nr:putative group 3 secretory phospholipase A2-like [Scophthalmus maximus]